MTLPLPHYAPFSPFLFPWAFAAPYRRSLTCTADPRAEGDPIFPFRSPLKVCSTSTLDSCVKGGSPPVDGYRSRAVGSGGYIIIPPSGCYPLYLTNAFEGCPVSGSVSPLLHVALPYPCHRSFNCTLMYDSLGFIAIVRINNGFKK